LPTVGNDSLHHLTGPVPSPANADAGMLERIKRWVVLSDHEQKVWDDIERFYAVEAEEPAGAGPQPPGPRKRDSRELNDIPAAVAAGGYITFMLILFGAPVAGLAVGTATALGWLLWRYWPQLSTEDAASALPVTGEVSTQSGAAHGRVP
jgi:hypothetical protein